MNDTWIYTQENPTNKLTEINVMDSIHSLFQPNPDIWIYIFVIYYAAMFWKL